MCWFFNDKYAYETGWHFMRYEMDYTAGQAFV